MGGTSWNDDVYSSRMRSAASTGKSAFVHDAAIRSGAKATAVHTDLDASKANKAGKLIRESFDSKEHPESLPIAVLFDVTGSMSSTPEVFIKKFGGLMKLLVKKGYAKHPHILFGAIGDAKSDRVPLQIGQFEAGNEMDDTLSKFFLEGNGGGQQTESYELGMYYMARHTDMDSFNKRGKKGYLFLIGDETPYPEVNKDEVKALIGDKLQSNISTPEILAELQEKFEVFWILPAGTSNWANAPVNKYLKGMFGKNLLKLQDAADISELIASTIGVCEGYDLDDIKNDLIDVGSSKGSVDNALASVKDIASSKSLSKKANVKGNLAIASNKDDVERL